MSDWHSTKTYFDVSAFEHTTLFQDCNFVWQALKKLHAYLISQPLGVIIPKTLQHVFLVNPELISIGENTIIEPGAYIQGPCIIGKDCQIRHGAYIRGNVLIGNGCVVGHTTEIKHSILLNEVKAAHFAFIGDSILGNSVNLGAGVKCANLRLDGKTIVIQCEDESYETGLRKLGSVIGDKTQIGCNVVANPGTLFGKHTHCFPSINVGGVIPPYGLIRSVEKSYRITTQKMVEPLYQKGLLL